MGVSKYERQQNISLEFGFITHISYVLLNLNNQELLILSKSLNTTVYKYVFLEMSRLVNR